MRQHFLDTRDGRKISFKSEVCSLGKVAPIVHRGWASKPLAHEFKTARQRGAHELIDGFVQAVWRTQFAEHLSQDRVSDPFAIDQHAVTVEDHKPDCRHGGFARSG